MNNERVTEISKDGLQLDAGDVEGFKELFELANHCRFRW